jgi:acetylglutamate kinase
MERAIEKVNVLMEALPYIRHFHDKFVVIKYGGGEKLRKDFVKDIVFMKFVGLRPILIHGGGPAINEEMKARGKKSKFINGLRVTDGETLAIAENTLMNINREITGLIEEAGGKAAGLNGKEFIRASKLSQDFGFVGEVEEIDGKLSDIIQGKVIPVIAPLGKGENDETLNINADEAASGISGRIEAEKLVLMTDVPGIMNGQSIVSTLKISDCEVLIREKVISGGMIPKVLACIKALKAGVKKAHIIDGRINHSLLLEIFTDKGVGTEIVV